MKPQISPHFLLYELNTDIKTSLLSLDQSNEVSLIIYIFELLFYPFDQYV